jgi:hypothetical protein
MTTLAADTRASFVLNLQGTDPVLCTSYQTLPDETPDNEIRRRQAVGGLVRPTALAVCGTRRAGQMVYLLDASVAAAWPFWKAPSDVGVPVGRLEYVRFEQIADERSEQRQNDEETDEQVIVSTEILDKMVWRLAVDGVDPIIAVGRALHEKKIAVATWDLPDDPVAALTLLAERLDGLDAEVELIVSLALGRLSN